MISKRITLENAVSFNILLEVFNNYFWWYFDIGIQMRHTREVNGRLPSVPYSLAIAQKYQQQTPNCYKNNTKVQKQKTNKQKTKTKNNF